MLEEEAWSDLAAVMEEAIHGQDDVRTSLARPYVLRLYARRARVVLERGRRVWRMAASVLGQSFWIGAVGLAVAFPVALLLGDALDLLGVKVLFPLWLLGPAAGLTMTTVLLSGLLALRSLRLVQPADLLR